ALSLHQHRSDSPERFYSEQLLWPLDPAQRVTANRDELTMIKCHSIGEGLREQYIALHRAAHRSDAGNLVDSGADHREIKPFFASDIPVEYLTDVQTSVHIRDRQVTCGPTLVDLTNPLLEELVSGDCVVAGLLGRGGGENRQYAISNQL